MSCDKKTFKTCWSMIVVIVIALSTLTLKSYQHIDIKIEKIYTMITDCLKSELQRRGDHAKSAPHYKKSYTTLVDTH